MFDQYTHVFSGHDGHTQRASTQQGSPTAIAALDADGDTGKETLVTTVSGCELLDGIRHGITRHGWTLPALAHRTELPMPMLRSIMVWRPGLPAADAVWWSLELEALAATHGRRFHCLSGRCTSNQLGQITHRLLRRNGSTWAVFAMKATEVNSAGRQPAGTGGWDGEDSLCVLDRMALAGGVAPVLLPA